MVVSRQIKCLRYRAFQELSNDILHVALACMVTEIWAKEDLASTGCVQGTYSAWLTKAGGTLKFSNLCQTLKNGRIKANKVSKM